MAKVHFIVRNMRAPDDERGPREVRAKHGSLEQAQAQWDAESGEHGSTTLLRIEDAQGNIVREA